MLYANVSKLNRKGFSLIGRVNWYKKKPCGEVRQGDKK